MRAEFGEVTVIIGLVINFLAFRLTIVRISWHLNIYMQLLFLDLIFSFWFFQQHFLFECTFSLFTLEKKEYMEIASF